MKAQTHQTGITTLVSLILVSFASVASAQFRLINFETIPPYPATVDSFAQLFPGLTLASGNQWVADEVNSSVFENIRGRSITGLSGALLTISFDSPTRDLTMDLGSGELGVTLTISIMGFLGGQPVFSQSFITHQVAGGADEVRAYTFGTVDSIVVRRTGGSSLLTLDNLSFVTVPEPTTPALLLAGGLVFVLRLRASTMRARRVC